MDGVSIPFVTSNGSGSTRKTRIDSGRETELLAENSRRFFLPGGFDVLYTFEG